MISTDNRPALPACERERSGSGAVNRIPAEKKKARNRIENHGRKHPITERDRRSAGRRCIGRAGCGLGCRWESFHVWAATGLFGRLSLRFLMETYAGFSVHHPWTLSLVDFSTRHGFTGSPRFIDGAHAPSTYRVHFDGNASPGKGTRRAGRRPLT